MIACRLKRAMWLFCALLVSLSAHAVNVKTDLSGVRGFNYTPASSNYAPGSEEGFPGFWSTNAATVERDLDYAKNQLNLNQVRVFIPFSAWAVNKSGFREQLVQFVRACRERSIGVMLVLYPDPLIIDALPEADSRRLLVEWVEDLVRTVGQEPGLAFWDAANEPDNLGYPVHNLSKERIQRSMELAKWMADTIHRLDRNIPVTIGCTYVACMEELSSSVDVLSYHDYSPTRAEIQANINEAKEFAAKVHKPVFNTEMSCIGRANPYDIALQEYQQAGVGWYVFELMITQYWGNIHGVLYPNGTVRDPSIAAAILGFFRNRGPNIVLENPDREGWVTRSVAEGRKWLDDPAPDWSKGLDIAETEANLLEAAQLIAMREPPTRTVDLLRAGKPEIQALQAAIRKFIAILEPYQNK
jgi:hypothetical protein